MGGQTGSGYCVSPEQKSSLLLAFTALSGLFSVRSPQPPLHPCPPHAAGAHLLTKPKAPNAPFSATVYLLDRAVQVRSQPRGRRVKGQSLPVSSVGSPPIMLQASFFANTLLKLSLVMSDHVATTCNGPLSDCRLLSILFQSGSFNLLFIFDLHTTIQNGLFRVLV